MVDPETVTLLQGGSALIVGAVAVDGAPYAARGWGLDVVGEAPCRVRLLVDAADDRLVELLGRGRPVAVTAADVVSLRSVQLKGTSQGVEPSDDPADRDRLGRYVDAFYADIEATDGTSRAVLDRLTPDDVLAVGIEVADVFDQTPGPGAGRAVGSTP